jgi:hypothetical protein
MPRGDRAHRLRTNAGHVAQLEIKRRYTLPRRYAFVRLTDPSFTCTPASHTTKRRGAAVAAPNNRFGRSDLQLP